MDAALAPDLAAAFATGLLSSLHCIGMCGPLASLGCRAGLSRSSIIAPLLFVSGKIVSYSVLGLLAGFAGAVLIGTNLLGKATAIASLAGGALMLIILALNHFQVSSRHLTRLSAGIAKSSLKTGRRAPLYLGIAAALLPCGLLYAMVARSAAAGAPLAGMTLMQAFGLGTSPALIGVGTLLRLIPPRWSRFGSIAAEIVMALTALILLWRGIAGFTMTPVHHSCCP
ncbi:MAG TPA: sulfite exporter TauE/SafE family protein [bacterium]